MKVDSGAPSVSFIPAGRPAFPVLHFSSHPARKRWRVCRLARIRGPAKRLVTARLRALHAPGYLLFWREGALLAQAFDLATLEVRGNPVSVANAVGLNPVTNQGLFSVSDSGTLVFFAGAVGQSQLVWVDRAGKRLGNAGPTGIFNSLSLSPDATSVVYDQAEPRNSTFDLWRLDFANGIPSRLTFHPSHDIFPALVARRHSYCIWLSSRGFPSVCCSCVRPALGPKSFFSRRTSRKLLRGGPATENYSSTTASIRRPAETSGCCRWSARASRIPVVRTTADEHYGTLSPDGRWLAYISNETGAYEVYVESFPATGFKRQVSAQGGFEPHWRRDGQGALLSWRAIRR